MQLGGCVRVRAWCGADQRATGTAAWPHTWHIALQYAGQWMVCGRANTLPPGPVVWKWKGRCGHVVTLPAVEVAIGRLGTSKGLPQVSLAPRCWVG